MKFLTEYLNSGSVKQQNKKRLGAFAICATAILLCLALIVLTAASIVTAVKNRKANTEGEGEEGGIPAGYVTTTLDPSQISSGNLILIDETHPYTTMPEVVSLLTVERPEGSVYSAFRDSCSLTQAALDALNKMTADFYTATQNDCLYLIKTDYGSILTFAYYDEETNTKTNPIYDAEAKKAVGDFQWIFSNAAKYGFVRASAAEGSEHVFRYVGVEHANAMGSLTNFPEYLEMLKTKNNKPSSAKSATVDGVRYKIYYQAAAEAVLVPEKNTYTVSGNNVDGYIITEVVSTKK